MTPPIKKRNQVDILIGFLQNNKFTGAIIFLGIILIAFAKVTESGDQLMRTFGLIKTYEVGQESPRGRFSAALIENAWNRIFWMRNYTRKVELGATKDEQAKSWDKLIQATEGWSSNLMNYYIGLDEYYPDGVKRKLLENVIQPKFEESTSMIVDIKYNMDSLNQAELGERITKVKNSVDLLNSELYHLVDQKEPNK
ncbi:hypothetical protein ACUN24_20350 [Pedobacter sp. WC2501]|uniref:hypothetical protein n=1 Tax=Pedobacter sp. WC2501 TaxID=3461400 RepID=UPI004045D3BA